MRFADFPPHVRLLLLAVRLDPSPVELAAIAELIDEPLDWAELLAIAKSHRLTSVLYENVKSLQNSSFFQSLNASLERLSTANRLRTARTALETQRLRRRFAEIGFELTVLKGVALSQTVYGEPTLRHVGDLDLLTTTGELPRQIGLMRELGYVLTVPAARLTPRRLSSYSRFWKDIAFQHKRSGLMVDLHWRLFNNTHHPGNRLLPPPPATTTIFGITLRTLPALDQFLYAALHGVSDGWATLKSLADVAAFLRRAGPGQMTAALERARELGFLDQVSSAVHLAAEWIGADTSHPLLLPESHLLHQMLRRQTLDRLIRHRFRGRREALQALAAARFELQLAPGVPSTIEIVRRYLYRPRVWSLVDLPDSLFWAYPALGLLLPPRIRPAQGRKRVRPRRQAE